MAGGSEKKLQKANAVYLRNFRLLVGVPNALYFAVRVWWGWETFSGFLLWAGYIALLLVSAFCYAGVAHFVKNDGDFKLGGVIEYYYDAVYICAATQVLSVLISDRAGWTCFLAIPGFLAWKAWQHLISPYVFKDESAEREEIESEKEAKKRAKLERKEKRYAHMFRGQQQQPQK